LNIKNKKTIVIKIGTTSLIKEGQLMEPIVVSLAQKIKDLQESHNFVIVTSGAVSLGAHELGYQFRPTSMKKLQVASSVGQIKLINEYQKIFSKYNLKIAQVLITKNLIDDREQFINTTQALNELLSQNIIPVINENDIVATEELKFGDNDRLSAIVSIIVNASKLIIVTNKEGLYDFNPDKNSEAKVIDFIQYDSSQLTDLIPISEHGEGQGGFSTKIMAAQMAGFSGIPTQIISWSEENVTKAINGEQVGTLILESENKIRLKKLWIAYGMRLIARVTIDEGAYLALKNDASLLFSGVIDIDGKFNINDGLEIFFEENVVAKGLAKTASDDTSKNSVLIHKDDLIIL
jgi:glutamate 5-kinase